MRWKWRWSIYIYGGLTMKLLVDFIEDRITPGEFLNEFYNDAELQAILEEETDIPKYTRAASLAHYIYEANASDLGSVMDIKGVIRWYLDKKEIPYTYSDKTDRNFKIYLSALPRWLNTPPEHFTSILDNNALSDKEKKAQIKEQVERDFVCLKKPPQWIQDVDWPFRNGKPLVFVGQLDLDIEIFHDKGAVYVFLDRDTGEIETIKLFY